MSTTTYTTPPERLRVATIMSRPEQFRLTQMEVDSVVDALQASGGIIDDVAWLAEEEACDIQFAVLPDDDAEEILTHLLAEVPVDFAVQPVLGRKKQLLICDMDSTIIQQECIDELADFLGIKPEISEITERAMNGELDFAEALRERVALLKGLTEAQLQEAVDTRITLTPGAETMVRTMVADGARAMLVSGGFTFFTSRVAEMTGFQDQQANRLELAEGVLTGFVKEPILDSQAKLHALYAECEELGLHTSAAVAVGDGANDLPMLKSAGLGVAFHAKPHVQEKARVKINSCDLTSVLYIQGYRRGEFVENHK